MVSLRNREFPRTNVGIQQLQMYRCVNAIGHDEQDYDLQINLSVYGPEEALWFPGG